MSSTNYLTLQRSRRSEHISPSRKSKSMSFGTMPHLIPLRQLIAVALTVTEEASITAPRPLDLRLEVPTFIEDPEATMKFIHAMTAALRVLSEVRAATATRRSINPSLVTFVTTSLPV